MSEELGILEWNAFPPEVVDQWFEKSDQSPVPPTQKYLTALSAQPFISTDVPVAVPAQRSTGFGTPSASSSGFKLDELLVWVWGNTTPWISKMEFSASLTLMTSLPSAIPPNLNPREYLKLSEKMCEEYLDIFMELHQNKKWKTHNMKIS